MYTSTLVHIHHGTLYTVQRNTTNLLDTLEIFFFFFQPNISMEESLYSRFLMQGRLLALKPNFKPYLDDLTFSLLVRSKRLSFDLRPIPFFHRMTWSRSLIKSMKVPVWLTCPSSFASGSPIGAWGIQPSNPNGVDNSRMHNLHIIVENRRTPLNPLPCKTGMWSTIATLSELEPIPLFLLTSSSCLIVFGFKISGRIPRSDSHLATIELHGAFTGDFP